MQRDSETSEPDRRQAFKRVERYLRSGSKLSTTSAVSSRMANIRQHGTAPELAVRRAARAAGIRFTQINRDLPGSPDLANRTRKIAVFVHGCYWHRHAGCTKATIPNSNREFWIAKFARNVERDRAVTRLLEALGFDVVLIWECEAKDIAHVARRLVSAGEVDR